MIFTEDVSGDTNWFSVDGLIEEVDKMFLVFVIKSDWIMSGWFPTLRHTETNKRKYRLSSPNLHTDLHDSSHLHQRDELSLHTVAQPSRQLHQQSFERPKLLQLLITDRQEQSLITFNRPEMSLSDILRGDVRDGDTSVKCSTQEQKAEEELSRVWTNPRLSWNLSATLHRLVSFSRENSTRDRYILLTTPMSTLCNTSRHREGQHGQDSCFHSWRL